MPQPQSTVLPDIPVVAVDTNALYGDLELQNSAWKTVLLRCRQGQLELWVPEVVVRETIRHHGRTLNAAIRKMRTGLSNVRSLRLDNGILPDRQELENAVRQKAEGYEGRLRSALRDAGAKILPLPTVSHEALLERALAERKPFRLKAQDPENKGPDGYRDALIWLSIAEAASATDGSKLLVFVTTNHKDFCDEGANDSSVSGDLLEDLPRTGLVVKRYSDLKEALAVLPEAADEPAAEPEPGVREQILEWVEEACTKSLPGTSVETHNEDYTSGYSFGDLQLPAALQNPTIQYIDLYRDSLQWSVHDSYEDGTELAAVSIEADVQFDGFAYKSDDIEGLEVHDADWNNHMMWVYATYPTVLSFNATISPQQEVMDVTFEGGDQLPSD
ncbi:PIN domain-containing protein [Streptomyces chartreusis]|uniref:PIN domain-containing protein n=1 Tax=Streptomyces chartreusis TaxID=1969 RepID=UPI003667B63A